MDKRYTVTFQPSIPNIDRCLKDVESMGVSIQSAQRFIGTAIVRADEKQVEQLKAMVEVVGVKETGVFSAIS